MMKNLSLALLVTVTLTACHKEIVISDGTSATHDNGYPANYDVVFEEDKVHRLDIIMDSDEWDDMQDNLTDIVGSSSGGGPGGPPPGNLDDRETPAYFECEVQYNGLTWEHVGIRYKGNSSLRAASGKLPLRFQFDQWEDLYPEIMDQRFHGFKELSMSSNYDDASLIREKTADDLFRSFGVPAVRTAYYEIYIDKGDGPEYYGVYTMCEVVFDTFLYDWFGSDDGNCYKPEGDGARFQASTFNLDDFEMKTNELVNDRADIQAMFNHLQSSTRTSNPQAWRDSLESVFDVDGFLKYLAVNNVIQNWDTYGRMRHNYYLYHDPSDDLIKWIVWDNNEAFQYGKMGGAVSFAMSEIGTDWPLMNYLIADDVYEAQYKAHMKAFIEGPFAVSVMGPHYDGEQTLLSASAAAERTGYSYVNGLFASAISQLKAHNATRVALAAAYVQ